MRHLDLVSFSTVRLAIALTVAAATATPVRGQTQSWASAVSGDWVDAAKWASGDAPDSAIESARFDRSGDYNVILTGGVIPIAGLEVVTGEIDLVTLGATDSEVAVAGDLIVRDALRLQRFGFGANAVSAMTVSIQTAATLRVEDATVNAGSFDVAIGWPSAATEAAFTDGSTGSLGAVSIGASGPGTGTSTLLLHGGSDVAVAALDVGSTPGAALSQLSVDNATLRQESGVATVGYEPAPGDSAGAVLTVDSGGVAEFDRLRVRGTGRVIISDGHATIATGLEVEGGGGVYDERAGTTRTLGPTAAIAVRSGGMARFDGGLLSVGAGQSIELGDDATLSGVGVEVAGGELRVVGNTSVIDAPVTLGPTGFVVIDAGADATFGDAFSNNGGALTVGAGATLTFEGDYAGAGATGAGDVVFRGSVNPGASPGAAAFGGDLTWDAGARYVAQLAGPTPAEQDSVSTAGAITLGGELAVELIDGFTPTEGDAFQLMTAASVSGAFATASMPPLPGGLAWRIDPTATGVVAKVIGPGPVGDYNADGVVDAADYTVWRDARGTIGPLLSADGDADGDVDAADYSVWGSAYGSTSSAAAVPEPAAVALATPLGVALRRRRRG